jgi:uroporphyrinogen III methyltransferase/synthase
MRDIGGVRIAAVGPATAAKLHELHLKVDLTPPEYTAAAIAGALAKYESIDNLKILLMRAEVAGKELPKKLEEMGAIVDDIACYKTVPETDDRNGAAARLLKDGAHWITFASASAVQNLHARLNLNQLLTAHPANPIRLHRPRNQQSHPRPGPQTRPRSQRAHHRRPGQSTRKNKP